MDVEPHAAYRYHAAYSRASQLLEVQRFNLRSVGHRADPAHGERGSILVRVLDQLGILDRDGKELAARAVDDAIRGRRPRF